MARIISDILSKERVLNKFLKFSLDEGESFHLYIHSPFCINQCSYCIHRGEKIKINGDLYKDYFENYLPNMIEFYHPVLEKNTPDSVYFGGGSSSIMTSKVMKNIFDKIPNFKQIKAKTFECDMSLLTKEKIQLLIDYNFTNVSFGVQTFNEDVLKKNNRFNPNLDKIKEVIAKLQEYNINVNCDLMIFIDNGDESDFEQLIKDMQIMTKDVKPNRITIYPHKFVLNKLLEENNKERAMQLIKNLQQTILENSPMFNNYFLGKHNMAIIENNETEKYLYYNYLIYKTPEDEIACYDKYNSSFYPGHPANQITLGIGSHGDNAAYLHIKKEFFVIENNIDNDYNKTTYKTMRESKYI